MYLKTVPSRQGWIGIFYFFNAKETLLNSISLTSKETIFFRKNMFFGITLLHFLQASFFYLFYTCHCSIILDSSGLLLFCKIGKKHKPTLPNSIYTIKKKDFVKFKSNIFHKHHSKQNIILLITLSYKKNVVDALEASWCIFLENVLVLWLTLSVSYFFFHLLLLCLTLCFE